MNNRNNDQFGAHLTTDGARFSVWAPNANGVVLLLNPQSPKECLISLPPIGNGFFEQQVSDVSPGTRYFFSADGAPAIPDPASRFQPDGVFGASELIDLTFAWNDSHWWGLNPQELLIYELHVGTFSPEGTYAGIMQRLDHFLSLGVTALELMPLAAFPGRWNWGYDGVFHFAPFSGYGRPADLQALIDACHSRGIAVILDIVTNHFGPEGNAMWSLAPTFFRPHCPTAWSSGINWEAEPVLQYFDEIALFWAREYHLDGLRFDAFHAIPEPARRIHLNRMVAALDKELPAQRHFLVLLESVDNQVSLLNMSTSHIHVTQLNFDYQRATHALVTREAHGEYQDFAHRPEEELAQCLATGFAFKNRYSEYHRRIRGESARPSSWDSVVNFTQNHDTIGNRYRGQRLNRLTDSERLQVTTALLLLHPGIPFMFMGQEWNASTPFYFFVDFPDHLVSSIVAGRKRGFREVNWATCTDRSPSCEEEAAYIQSVLNWVEVEHHPHVDILKQVKGLVGLRKQVLPLMSRATNEVYLKREGAVYYLQINARQPEHPPFLLIANFSEKVLPIPENAGSLIYSSKPAFSDQIPALCCQLYGKGVVVSSDAEDGHPIYPG